MKRNLIFSSGFRRYIQNTLWLISEKLLSVVAVLLVSVWIARYLGPSQFGQLSFAQSIVGLFASIAPLGLTRILERDLVSKNSNKAEIVNTSIILVLMGATVVYTLMLCFLALRSYEGITNQLIIVIGVSAFFQVNSIFTAYFYSQVQAKKLATATVLALLVSNSIKISLILSEAELIFFAIAMLLDSAILCPILVFMTKNTDAFIRIKHFSLDRARSLLKDSWPYILTGFLTTVYMRIDTIMIKEILDDYSAGQYAAAVRLSQGLYYIPVTLLASIYPAIVNAKQSSESLYNHRLSNLYSFLFYSAIAIAIVVSFFDEYLINTLYGNEYSQAVDVLFIHVWSSVFVFVGACSGRWLLTENLRVIAACCTFIGALSNIVLNLYLIPRYGIEGAACATLVSYSLSGYFCFWFWKRTRPNFILMSRSFIKIPKLNW